MWLTHQACRDGDHHPTLQMRGRPAELRCPPGPRQGWWPIPPLLLQLVGQVYLLLPHALHQQPGPLQLLLSFCNILGPEQGPAQRQPPPGPGVQAGEGCERGAGARGAGPATRATPTGGAQTVGLAVREEGTAERQERQRPASPGGNPRSTCPQYPAPQCLPRPSTPKNLRPAVLGRPLSQHTWEPGLNHPST